MALVVPRLVAALEELRELVARPIVIVSGYRCPVHNAAVGGAPHSQHMLGTAADIRPGVASRADAERVGFRGIGSLGKWAVHVDVRDGARARWNYSR